MKYTESTIGRVFVLCCKAGDVLPGIIEGIIIELTGSSGWRLKDPATGFPFLSFENRKER
ncbi:MAG: hypothetical protein JW904_09765 [Spirochaetales bacterium]|nr:hypothetical protein [Spirochaetales bacterium]